MTIRGKRARQGGRLTPARTATTAVVNDRALVHCERTQRIHCLDLSATVVWTLCDGSREVRGVIADVASLVGRDATDVAGHVEAAIAEFRALGILR